jgi:hypothetical protein
MKKHFVVLLVLFTISFSSSGQMITGVWKGRIDKKKVELKIIQNGDSLFGTSYYYESPGNYRRYTIKGYLDAFTNEAVWWDDELIEEKTRNNILSVPGKIPYLSSADFNCPGSGKMFLDGNTATKSNPDKIKGAVELEKTGTVIFRDEWDFIIENYTAGANDPYIIDSVATVTSASEIVPEKKETLQQANELPVTTNEPGKVKSIPVEKAEPVKIQSPPKPEPSQLASKKIQEDFRIREKVIESEIPLAGDSIELRFYDNAEIDGDSISLFLNDKLIFQHIRLTAIAYIIKLPVQELNETNELVMVAENLGSIPPNTSYMSAIVENKRYETMLKSTEETSAVIRLVKPKSQNNAQTKN